MKICLFGRREIWSPFSNKTGFPETVKNKRYKNAYLGRPMKFLLGGKNTKGSNQYVPKSPPQNYFLLPVVLEEKKN
jgi:hypothetical protein